MLTTTFLRWTIPSSPGGMKQAIPAPGAQRCESADAALLANLGVAELPFHGLKAFGERRNNVPKFVELLGKLACTRRDCSRDADIGALPLSRHDKPGIPEATDGALGRADGDAVLGRERLQARQLLPRRQDPRSDVALHQVGQLQVRRAGVVRIERHGAKGSPSQPCQHIGHTVGYVSLVSYTGSNCTVGAWEAAGTRTPRSVRAHRAGQHIDTLGGTMHGQRTRLYRVKTVAEMYDVSVATIYRAIETGQLRALKLGKGRGTLRIPESALDSYTASCGGAPACEGRSTGPRAEPEAPHRAGPVVMTCTECGETFEPSVEDFASGRTGCPDPDCRGWTFWAQLREPSAYRASSENARQSRMGG